ncbi:hypothetical protein RFI_06264 [Reticulomyxa filosa]|uniref:Uncharacterized protein n=1 Tax=Reticulomyxa filosa TaxID=46433 RepID=X6NZY7_RETFI|nr:hypothetical protein RFI_06264 [Reticulomyxa filosa]|eukprot:ETO30857.1 hypothetical protein RFI_06264 [Reticulomyxa filosa]
MNVHIYLPNEEDTVVRSISSAFMSAANFVCLFSYNVNVVLVELCAFTKQILDFKKNKNPSKMSLFTLIGRSKDGLLLCGTSGDSNDLPELKKKAKQIIKTAGTGKEDRKERVTINHGDYIFHYYTPRDCGIIYLTLVDSTYPQKLAFSYLDDLHRSFFYKYSQNLYSFDQAYSCIDFAPELDKLRIDYLNPDLPKNVSRIKHMNTLGKELEEVTEIMRENISSVMHRGHKLDAIHDTSNRLLDQSLKFKQKIHNTVCLLTCCFAGSNIQILPFLKFLIFAIKGTFLFLCLYFSLHFSAKFESRIIAQMSKNLSDTQWKISVNLQSCEVITDVKKNSFIVFSAHVLYVFLFDVQGKEHVLKTRYSSMSKLHDELVRDGILDRAFGSTPPNFPGKAWFKDMTKPKNYEKRGQELLEYLRGLVSSPTILQAVDFQKGIELSDNLISVVVEIANNMDFFFFCINHIQKKKKGKHFYNQIKRVLNESLSSNVSHHSGNAEKQQQQQQHVEGNKGEDNESDGDNESHSNRNKNNASSANEQKSGIVDTSRNNQDTGTSQTRSHANQPSASSDNLVTATSYNPSVTTTDSNPREEDEEKKSKSLLTRFGKDQQEQAMATFKQTLRHLTENIDKELIEIVENLSVEHALDAQELNELEDEYHDLLESFKPFHLSDVLQIEDETYQYPSVSDGLDRMCDIVDGKITDKMEGLNIVEELGTDVRDLLLATCDLGGNFKNGPAMATT